MDILRRGNMKSDEMVEGYLAGYRSNSEKYPDYYKDKSAAFKHGWLNGNDDALRTPRDKAAVLRARAAMIIGEESDALRIA